MKHELEVALGARSYPIVVADGADEAWAAPLAPLAAGRHVAVVTDENVDHHYRTTLDGALAAAGPRAVTWCVVSPGEASKGAATLDAVYTGLLAARFPRDGLLCALGGGVVGDLAGYAAATLHRGVDLVQLPTSLLAMVDSAIGGKVGINHPAGKNLIGAFKQPRAVLTNIGALRTLPEREWRSAFAEIIKYGVIADAQLFETVRAHAEALRGAADRRLLDIVLASARIKADVVSRDEQESGLRMILNFGHTLGHAIERSVGYGRWTHGEAVAAGMVLAGELGVARGITPAPVVEAIAEACRAYGLPDGLPRESRAELVDAIGSDKKVRGDEVRFIFAERLGAVRIDGVPLDELSTWLRD